MRKVCKHNTWVEHCEDSWAEYDKVPPEGVSAKIFAQALHDVDFHEIVTCEDPVLKVDLSEIVHCINVDGQTHYWDSDKNSSDKEGEKSAFKEDLDCEKRDPADRWSVPHHEWKCDRRSQYYGVKVESVLLLEEKVECDHSKDLLNSIREAASDKLSLSTTYKSQKHCDFCSVWSDIFFPTSP